MRKDSFFFFFWETAPWTRGGATIPLKFQLDRLHQRPLGLPQSKYKKEKNYKLLLLSYELLCYPAYVYVWKLSAWNVRIGPWCWRECDQSSLQRSSHPSWPEWQCPSCLPGWYDRNQAHVQKKELVLLPTLSPSPPRWAME